MLHTASFILFSLMVNYLRQFKLWFSLINRVFETPVRTKFKWALILLTGLMGLCGMGREACADTQRAGLGLQVLLPQ